jgi:DNA-binding YbaB/EbfC family protein
MSLSQPPDDATPADPMPSPPVSPDVSPDVIGADAQPVNPIVDPMAALLGGGDLSGLLQAAQEMQAELANAQAQAAETMVEGVSGGGAVRIEATAGLEFRAVHVRPDALDGGDAEMLEDLILAALRDVVTQANHVQAEALGDLGGLGGMLPGS